VKRGLRAPEDTLCVPAFAVERTQQLVLLLHELIDAKQIRSFPIYVDSRLAVASPGVSRNMSERVDEEPAAFTAKGEYPFGWKRPALHPERLQESKALNDLARPLHRDVGLGNVRGLDASCTT